MTHVAKANTSYHGHSKGSVSNAVMQESRKSALHAIQLKPFDETTAVYCSIALEIALYQSLYAPIARSFTFSSNQ